jgi:hypothetical protein
MSDKLKYAREVISECLVQFKLLESFANAKGPIIQHGHGKVSKNKAIAQECGHAIVALIDYLDNQPS